MTDAELEWIDPDPYLGRIFLEQAKQFFSDGNRTELAHESRQVLLHGAVIAACDAALAAEGMRVTGSDGGHRLRLEKAEELLDLDDDVFDALDQGRVARNAVSYGGGFVLADDVEDTASAVAQLIEAVEARLPPQPNA